MLTRLDTHFLKIAKITGERSSFAHSKRGAVLAIQNRIISTGVSSHLEEGKANTNNEEERYVATVSAELMAISNAVKNNTSILGATIYLSESPTWISFKIIATMGIKRIVHYGKQDNERVQHYAKLLGMEVLSIGL